MVQAGIFYYLILSALLIFFLSYLPALAVFPQLARQPLYFSSVPILSYLMMGVLAFILRFFHLFYHEVLIIILGILLVIFILRGIAFTAWKKSDFAIMLFNFFLVLPLIFLAIYSAFSGDDALASWNYWAKLYYFSQPSHQSLYPTLYPSFLSVAYQVLGSFEAQGLVKVLLVTFIFSLLNAIAFVSSSLSRHFIAYFIVIILVLFPGNALFSLYHFSVSGYADPVLAGVMAISLALFIAYCKKEESFYLFLTLLTAIAAAWTKQPGLLWAGMVLPLALIVKIIFSKTKKNRLREALVILIALIAALYWVLIVGQHFYSNAGVLGASKAYYAKTGASLSYFQIFFHSVLQYLIEQPTLLLLLLLASISAYRQYYLRIILVALLWLGFILWFVFASYELREGFYLFAICGVLIAGSDYVLFTPLQNLEHAFSIYAKKALIIMAFLSVLLTAILTQLSLRHAAYDIFPLKAGKTIFCHYFLDQAELAYKTLYQDKAAVVGGVSNYENGIFFGQKSLVPLYSDSPQAMLADLKKTSVKFVMISARISPSQFGAMKALNEACPRQIILLDWGRIRSAYQIFEINHIDIDRCNLTMSQKEKGGGENFYSHSSLST